MKRKRLVAVLLCALLMLAVIPLASAASDDATVEQVIKAIGVMNGDQNGNMNLDKSVTRAEFAKMMIMASTYKNTVSGASSSSPFKDVKHDHWAAGYIQAAVNVKWLTGYLDGTYRPNNTITYEEAASAILKMLGYTASDLTGAYPQAQINKFKALKLDDGVTPSQGQPLTRYECMYFFYNLMGAETKTGAVYGSTLGYTINSEGYIDYDELVRKNIAGPFVVNDSPLSSIVPFDLGSSTLYRNGRIASSGAVVRYDVVYYNTDIKTVWVYSNRVVGTLTGVTPNTVLPASVTVAGNSYSLGTSAAKSMVSVTGDFIVGDQVALLLGMDGDVVEIVPAGDVNISYNGIVTKTELVSSSVGTTESRIDFILSVACTDGVVRQFSADKDAGYLVGNIVSVNYVNGEAVVTRPQPPKLSGTFSGDGKKFGDYDIADDIEILDISNYNDWTVIYLSRLSGVSLPEGSVSLCAFDAQGRINRLILKDATGDMYSYGVLTDVQGTVASGTSLAVAGSYDYVMNGSSGSASSSGTFYRVTTGGAIFYYNSGRLAGIKNIASVTIDSLTGQSASGGNKTYQLASNVQVYIKSSDDTYTSTQLSAVNANLYTLTGYYETLYPAGGQIRIIVAVKK